MKTLLVFKEAISDCNKSSQNSSLPQLTCLILEYCPAQDSFFINNLTYQLLQKKISPGDLKIAVIARILSVGRHKTTQLLVIHTF